MRSPRMRANRIRTHAAPGPRSSEAAVGWSDGQPSRTFDGRRGRTMRDADTIVKSIMGQLETKSSARDRAIRDSRLVIRHAANTIRALHRGDFALASQSLEAG